MFIQHSATSHINTSIFAEARRHQAEFSIKTSFPHSTSNNGTAFQFNSLRTNPKAPSQHNPKRHVVNCRINNFQEAWRTPGPQ